MWHTSFSTITENIKPISSFVGVKSSMTNESHEPKAAWAEPGKQNTDQKNLDFSPSWTIILLVIMACLLTTVLDHNYGKISAQLMEIMSALVQHYLPISWLLSSEEIYQFAFRKITRILQRL